MKKKSLRSKPMAREEPRERRSVVWMTDREGFDSLECSGYTNLAHNPEIVAAVDTIARLIGAMSLHLMRNTERGDVREINELSRIVDINPSGNMTRSNFVQWIVKTLFLEGQGNCVVYPKTSRGYLREMIPIPAAYTSFIPDGEFGYKVYLTGKEYDPDNVLHFVLNPNSFYPWLGDGFRIALKDVADNLKQAAATEKGFMSSKWKPSLIVKVDALVDEFASKEGRQKLLDSYVKSGTQGEPWLIPAEQFDVQQVKPLTLSDLALADFVQLDKKTVAAILGVPSFVLGVDEFKRDEWNNFISSTIMPIAENIQQELTRKLLYSPDLYFRFNSRSLYNYDLRDLADVADEQYVRGIMTGNEVRGWLNLPPLDGLDELILLENYIPLTAIGDQKKLNNGGGDSGD